MLHGVNPALEGKPAPANVTNAAGRPITELIRDALRGNDSGIVTYSFPKPGQAEPQPKVSYVARFAPWDLVFIAGAYVDDLDVAFHGVLYRLSLIGGIVLIITLIAAFVVNRDISASLGALKSAMDRLAGGDLATAIPGTDRRDEIGGMAATVVVFKDNMIETERLRGEQEESKRQAAAKQKDALHMMADEFESKVGHLVGLHFPLASTELEATAQSMTGTANQSNQQAAAVAAAAEEASTGMQTVASAAEELSASIGEIARQVTQLSEIADRR